MPSSYSEFIERKRHRGADHGFDPMSVPDFLFDFQRHLVEWSLRKGRCAIFADCGLGKTPMQLVWADNVAKKTGKRVLILTPLSVAFQTEAEAEKFGIDGAAHCRCHDDAKSCRIAITNYERLHLFEPSGFAGVVCDESSILKGFDGSTRMAITSFMRHVPFRLLCTATAAPNDWIELGTSSEALGDMGLADVLSTFFKKVEKTFTRRDEHRFGVYRFRGHAEVPFWRWVCSWARAIRKPSDLGFSDDGFDLQPLAVSEHLASARRKADGFLFDLAATDLRSVRQESRRTLAERCELAAGIINDSPDQAVAWCNLNDESRMLSELIEGSCEIDGQTPEDRRESAFKAFAQGQIKAIVTKPVICGFGLNWQHCHRMTYFPTHSYEQYYQAVRRLHRFGQSQPVEVHLISTDGGISVARNLSRKAEQADRMFSNLVSFMADELFRQRRPDFAEETRIPKWLKAS